jgi:N-acetylmuramic acid 6-phosphate (MurNAc-6-P) etherase
MISASEVSGINTRPHDLAALIAGAAVSLNPDGGGIFTLTPAEAETITPTKQIKGQRIVLIITTSGTSSYVITFGTGFKSTGTLATGTTSGKIFVLEFISDGTNYIEVARTTAQ